MTLASTMKALVQQFSSCLTKPTFQTFCIIAGGWLLGRGCRTVTHVLLTGGGLNRETFSCYHRFFSQARCSADEIGRIVLQLVLKFIPQDAPVVVAVDDTLNRKTGRRIWAAAMHHDPLRSTARRAVLSFGHNWVVLSVQLALPFAPTKTWSLPILMRLYRRKQKKRKPGKPRRQRKAIGQAAPAQYHTRPQLAREMIALVASWLPDRTVQVVGDSDYAGKSISRHLPDNVHLTSRMVTNAALYDLPPKRPQGQRGAPRKKGQRLPAPAELAQSRNSPWKKTTASIYGKHVRLWYKTCVALWYNSAGARPLRIVVVRDPSARRRDDCLFTTDLVGLSPKAILELFAMRWPLEVTFYNAKQCLGLEDPQNRTPKAVQRTAPLAICLYTLTVLWLAKHGHFNLAAYRKAHPWYRQNRPHHLPTYLPACGRPASTKAFLTHPPIKRPPKNPTVPA